MQKSVLTFVLYFLCPLAFLMTRAQAIYYNTSSSTLSLNTLDNVATNGSPRITLLTATGSDFNRVNRCTAVALDALNGKLFLIDGAASSLWSVNLNGSGLTLVKSGLTNYPTDLALDVQRKKIYFTTSSAIQSNNTIQGMDYTGSNNAVVFTATGLPGNGVSRCTAIALDVFNSKIFIADAGAGKIWSMSLAGSSLTALATNTNATPTGLALDVTNQQVYFSLSSPVQGSNLIQRVKYNGSGLTTLFTAAGKLQRCTALDLDLAHGAIYLSDAATKALWRVLTDGSSATVVLSGLPATAKKVRWFNGSPPLPSPFLAGFYFSGTNVVLNVTNAYAGGTYYLLTSTNLAAPFSLWSPVSTNVLSADGDFIITASNALVAHASRQFYILQVQ